MRLKRFSLGAKRKHVPILTFQLDKNKVKWSGKVHGNIVSCFEVDENWQKGGKKTSRNDEAKNKTKKFDKSTQTMKMKLTSDWWNEIAK
jgi:hypothetical protein